MDLKILLHHADIDINVTEERQRIDRFMTARCVLLDNALNNECVALAKRMEEHDLLNLPFKKACEENDLAIGKV